MAKTISLNKIRKNCAQLVAKWKDEPGDERQQGQTFVRDLFKAFGMTDSQIGTRAFEGRTKRASTGAAGYIDALIPGVCIVEMKSAGKDLIEAERQAVDYLENLTPAQLPRYVITSDFFNFRILDLHAVDSEHRLESFTLAQLPERADALLFLAGYEARTFGDKEQEQASIKAARIMADFFASLEGCGFSDHEASVFLIRTLFCLYADDAGVWDRNIFYEFILNRTDEDGSDLGMKLTALYQVLSREVRQENADEFLTRFPYVNGGIFSERLDIPHFAKEVRDQLIKACNFNWSSISPAIFGSLFQAVKSADARRHLGEHYTTETNILKTIGPLFLDELRERFAKETTLKGLQRLREDLGNIRIMDPACGCGNFLVVAYKEMRALDLEILKAMRKLGADAVPTMFFTKEHLPVRLENFKGIEIEEWPAQIATTALYLAEHQANLALEHELGMAPDPLPLGKVECISVANALRTEWERVMPPSDNAIIIGNPPFIGQYLKTKEQTQDLQLVWGDGYDGYLDYVTGWYKKAADYFRRTTRARFAFVSTNSITQGQPVRALFEPLFNAGFRIRFAHQTFAWTSEAPGMAHVHCVIVGFDKKEKSTPLLFTYAHPKATPLAQPAHNINAYLIDAPSFFITSRTKPLTGIPKVNYGSKKVDGGNLIVEKEDYAAFASDPITAKYLRRFVGARELIHAEERYCLWMADEDFDPKDIQRSQLLKERVTACKDFRDSSKKKPTRDAASSPHLFVEIRLPDAKYLAIPIHVSEGRKYFTVDFFTPEVITSNACFTASDPDGYLFALISSSMYMTWQRTVGGTLESRLRFSNTVVWNNFPLPEISDKTRQAIIEAGQKVLAARSLFPGRSLEDLYHPLAMEPALLKAHDALDRVVDKAFGARKILETEEQRLALLFKRYSEIGESH